LSRKRYTRHAGSQHFSRDAPHPQNAHPRQDECWKAGAEIYEYEAAMIHAKIMIVDGVWSIVGSTNMDSRSFGINDEINLAVFDNSIADRLTQDFQQNIAQSRRIALEK